MALVGVLGCDGSALDPYRAGTIYGSVDVVVTGATPASGDIVMNDPSAPTIAIFPAVSAGHTEVRAGDRSPQIMHLITIVFETSTGDVVRASYSWGFGSHEVGCYQGFSAGCLGIIVDTGNRVITFTSALLDNATPTAAATKFATLDGTVGYP
jgi:hypothetical protein